MSRLTSVCFLCISLTQLCVFWIQVSEKEKLLSERNQLKVCMAELWQNLSFLSQQVCSEVQSSQTQPVSATIDLTSDSLSSCPDQDSAKARSSVSLQDGVRENPEELKSRQPVQDDGPLLLVSNEELCSPTVTVDFCQEMTVKCTTEEADTLDSS